VITFRVKGLPPKKVGTKKDGNKVNYNYSRWNADSEKSRALALADAAKTAMCGKKIIEGKVELIIRLKIKRTKKIGDAANFIGGIADVLQGWKKSLGSNHEPKDQEIKEKYKDPIIYNNDSQIRKICYAEDEPAQDETEHYIVTVGEF
jgi:hypothetical protein